MKIRCLGLNILILILLLTGAALAAGQSHKTLFQTSTLQALMNGVYDGDYSFGELKKHGDFGLGTFKALEGGMVALDGKFYQVKSDRQGLSGEPPQKTPFAQVTFFKADKTLELGETPDLNALENYLSARLPSRNFPYAIKITGKFAYIKARSLPRQAKPYPSLTEAAKHQAVFEFRDVEGVIVGFYHPSYLAGVNLAGYHFHFLTEDRQAGGHLLDCRLDHAKVDLARLDDFELRLPGNPEFARTDLSGDQKQAIEAE